MKIRTKLTAGILTVCMMMTMLTLPAGAADTVGFSDITDAKTAVSVECLRLLGVLDGYGDGTFRPENSLTRAQFCKMAIYAMNSGSEAGQYKAYTIYPDVRSSHWAAAYINMAAKGKKIILGYPDGNFHPDRTVSYGQAVTILMRLLGYTDADVGAVWPDGYLAAAKTAGLTRDLTLSANAVLTRGQAARLFSNLLTCKTKEGGDYADSIAGGKVSNVVLLSSSAKASDGTSGAMQVSDGNIYKMAGKQSNGLLNGHKGTLLLGQNGRVLTFVPVEEGNCRTVTVATAKAGSLKTADGAEYTLSASVTAYADGKQQTWGDIYSWLLAGNSVTLYQNAGGTVEYVYVGTGASVSTSAVIVSAKGSTAGFRELAGGNTGYAIRKNGVSATAADLRQYDVATYDSATNTIQVCDTRITGRIENCWPNMDAPSKITMLGYEFTVLPSGAAQFSGSKIGSQVTLLLTADNQVAGMTAAVGSAARGNAIGMVTNMSSGSVTVRLMCGVSVSGIPDGGASQNNRYTGQLVRVSSSRTGYLSLSALSGGTSATLNVTDRKLGNTALADNVVIYEKVRDSVMTPISLSDIYEETIPGSKITYVGKDWAGRANLLILNDATGNCYSYGRVKNTGTTTERVPVTDKNGVEPGEENWIPTYETETSHGSLTVVTPSGTLGPFDTGITASNGTYVGVAVSAGDSSSIADLITLERISNVPNSAWNGQGMVTANGTTYLVPDTVVCYNKSADLFVTLSAAHAFAEKCTLYVDEHNVVRALEVSQ